jgi:transposase
MDLEIFIGIDVSKDTLDVACYREQKETISSKFKNDKGGFRKILNWIKSNTDSSSQQWLVCFEHTGIYSWPLSCFLSESQINYSIQPALQIKRSMGIQRGKNDKTDARVISKFAYLHRKEIKLTTLPSKALISLKNLLSYRDRLVKSKVSLQIAAKELGAYTARELHSFIVKDSAQLIKTLVKSIREVDKQIEGIIREDSQLSHLFNLSTSVKGVGLQVAANMLVYTEGFTKFDNWRKFSCYCGLAPFEYQSGISIRGKTRTSHLGNKKMKAMIGNGVASAIQWDPELSIYYQRKLQEGKPKMVVQTAIKNKIISRVFATVKRGTPFVPLFNHVKA